MLALLGASLLLTAVIVRSTYTSAINLTQTAKMLEDNLHKKEDYINKLVSTKKGFDHFKTLANNGDEGLNYIHDLTVRHSIWVFTAKNNNLQFWSGIKYIPQNFASIKNGYSFIKEINGYYEVFKKSEGDFSVIFLIPVKTNYTVQNQYLQNAFYKDLLKDNNIEIADFTDKSIYSIHSINDTYLFSVKVNDNEVNYRFFYFELVL